MMQQLRAKTERLNASAAPVVGAALTPFGFTTTDTTSCAWNVMPSVHTNAISTHGNKRYEWRLREMPS